MQPINSIILIDDDRIFNQINEKTIHQASFAITIRAYLNAEKALAELKDLMDNNPAAYPEVIFLDINMPGMNGWEFLEGYKELQLDKIKSCSIYVLSSSIDPNDIEKSKTFDMVDGFLSKPLDIEKLHEIREKIKNRVLPGEND